MKKLFSILGTAALAIGLMAFAIPSALALAPAGTMTSTALTVDLGQLKAINAIVVTDAGGEITDATDIKIRIPEGVNAIWDTADTTIVADVTGATGVVSTTVTYESAKIVVLDVTTTFTAGDAVTISGLSMIGQTATSVATALDWAVDGATYLAGDATTKVTVANGAEDTLTSVDISALDPVTGATTTYTVVFTVPATGVIPKDGKIVLLFPAGFDTAGVGATATSATMDGTLAAATSDAGLGVTITRTGTTNATAGLHSFNLTGIVNGAAGTHSVTLTTQTVAAAVLASGTDAAHIITAAPAAIDNLTCESSGQAGSVWLRWTTPAGASISYTAKHALAAMTNDGEFNAGTTFSQTWPVLTVGSSAQNLVTGLNPNTRYYFAVKSTGFGPTTSAISTPAGTTCIAPSSAAPSSDLIAPISYITSPASGSTIAAGTAYTIKGTASDTGGSSVQKMELSLDGGTTWNPASVKAGDTGTNVTWEYTWASPSAGSYTIKTRATDWVSNTETPGAGITITVSSTGAVITTPSGVAAPGLQIATPPGLTGVQAQIYTLQAQLISLLQQLLAMLLAAR
jgi:hypothetical protein